MVGEPVKPDSSSDGSHVVRSCPVNLSCTCSVACSVLAVLEKVCVEPWKVVVDLHGATEANMNNVVAEILGTHLNLSGVTNWSRNEVATNVLTELASIGPGDLCTVKPPEFRVEDSATVNDGGELALAMPKG